MAAKKYSQWQSLCDFAALNRPMHAYCPADLLLRAKDSKTVFTAHMGVMGEKLALNGKIDVISTPSDLGLVEFYYSYRLLLPEFAGLLFGPARAATGVGLEHASAATGMGREAYGSFLRHYYSGIKFLDKNTLRIYAPEREDGSSTKSIYFDRVRIPLDTDEILAYLIKPENLPKDAFAFFAKIIVGLQNTGRSLPLQFFARYTLGLTQSFFEAFAERTKKGAVPSYHGELAYHTLFCLNAYHNALLQGEPELRNLVRAEYANNLNTAEVKKSTAR